MSDQTVSHKKRYIMHKLLNYRKSDDKINVKSKLYHIENAATCTYTVELQWLNTDDSFTTVVSNSF